MKIVTLSECLGLACGKLEIIVDLYGELCVTVSLELFEEILTLEHLVPETLCEILNLSRWFTKTWERGKTKRGSVAFSTGFLLGCVSIWHSCRFLILFVSVLGMQQLQWAAHAVVLARVRSDHLRSVVGALVSWAQQSWRNFGTKST